MRPAATWGGLRLYSTQSDTEAGNNLVRHEPNSGRDYVIQNRGPVLEVVRMELVFCPMVGEEATYLDRYAELRRLRNLGKPQLFVHPLHGSYRAELGDCRVVTNADDMITVSAEFVPAEEVQPVFEVAGGIAPIAGPEAVAAAAGLATLELAALELEDGEDLAGATAAIGGAVETSATWVDEGADSRSVYLEVGEAIAAIDGAIADLDLALDYTRWQAYVEMIALRTALLDAADAATSAAERVAVISVEVATPLLTICAREYGASQARERADEVAARNDLRDRLMVPAGTRLELPIAGRRA